MVRAVDHAWRGAVPMWLCACRRAATKAGRQTRQNRRQALGGARYMMRTRTSVGRSQRRRRRASRRGCEGLSLGTYAICWICPRGGRQGCSVVPETAARLLTCILAYVLACMRARKRAIHVTVILTSLVLPPSGFN
jgi:hypothetical protein